MIVSFSAQLCYSLLLTPKLNQILSLPFLSFNHLTFYKLCKCHFDLSRVFVLTI
ncbi:hypothetical protein HanRHA438_Chr02g0062811 [Helianthus annuus]|nr:hypothetical protein HanRHA438_Chr02g0062811 [Helianthus annuus]